MKMEQYETIPFERMLLKGCKDFCNENLGVLYFCKFEGEGTSYDEQMKFLSKFRRCFNDIKSRAKRRNITNIFMEENKYAPLTCYDMSKIIQDLYELYTGNDRFTNADWLKDAHTIYHFVKSNVNITTKYDINEQKATIQSIIRLLEAIGQYDISCIYRNLLFEDKQRRRQEREARRMLNNRT